MLKFLKDYQCIDFAQLLALKYTSCGLSEQEFALLEVIIALKKAQVKMITPALIGEFMSLKATDIDRLMIDLIEKKWMQVQMGQISLQPLYEKLLENEEKVSKEESVNLIDVFENEFSRPLSPTEMEIIRHWMIDGYSEDMVVMALSEAIKNGVKNFKYIEAILKNWKEHGVHYSNKTTIKDVPQEEVSHFEWWKDYE